MKAILVTSLEFFNVKLRTPITALRLSSKRKLVSDTLIDSHGFIAKPESSEMEPVQQSKTGQPAGQGYF